MMRRVLKSRRRAHDDGAYPLEPALDFMRLLWSIEHALERKSKRMDSELGITGPQRLVLRVVGRFPDVSPGELAQILRLHPSTITGIVQRLVTRKLIERMRDPGDSRRTRLRVKSSARAFTRASPGTVERAVTHALGRAGKSQVRAARNVLAAIAEELARS